MSVSSNNIAFKTKAIFENAVRRKDGSFSLRFSTLEVKDVKIIAELLLFCDTLGELVFAGEDFPEQDIPEIETDDVMPKSQSQRMRNVLWVWCKQELKRDPSDSEFRDFYNRKMDAFIEWVKTNKLND